MTNILNSYASVVGQDVIDKLRRLAEPLQGTKVVHVNSTRVGGGVAEILYKLVPLLNELGLRTDWEIIEGNAEFYACTKSFHNGLQGDSVSISDSQLSNYEKVNVQNAERLRPALEQADFVFIHDPQPAALLQSMPDRQGKWIWRCHIDASKPYRPVWKYLRRFVSEYDASIFSLSDFAQPLPHPQYLVPPSIDPLSEKNIDLDQTEIQAVVNRFGLDASRPLVLQVSRFDRFKDPVGVIQAFQIARRGIPGLQLVLAGGSADDDPEGAAVLDEVRSASGDDGDIHVLLLPPDAHRVINALQRASDIVLQKSTREGFGLTVTEAMWKSRPVIGGNTGGIRLQVIDHHTGFLVSSPEGAALRIRYLLTNRENLAKMGATAHAFARDNFLLTRHIAEYLTLMLLQHNGGNRVELQRRIA
jgi:trehalose synthase